MKKIEKFKLFDSTFSADEATDLLCTIINAKIQFYSVKNLTSQVRNGVTDEYAFNKVAELKNTKLEICKKIEGAKKNNLGVKLESNLNLSVLSNK